MTIQPKPQVTIETVSPGLVFRAADGTLSVKINVAATASPAYTHIILASGLAGIYAVGTLVTVDNGFYVQGNS